METISCPACNSSVELPANFCDMCGINLETTTTAELPKTNDWMEPTLRILIPSIAVGFGVYYFIIQKHYSLVTLLFSLPLIAGTIAGSANSDYINDLYANLNKWTLLKLENVKEGGGKRHRFFFRPWYWMLQTVASTGQNISNPYIRSGFSVAAFLFVCSLMIFIAYIAVSLIIGLIIIGIALWILTAVLDGGTSSSSTIVRKVSRNDGKERLIGKKLYDTKGLFKREVGYVDENGRVFDSTGLARRQVGEIDKDGNISDTTGFIKHKIAEIDDDGNISDTTGLFKHKVAEVNKEGQILNTKGFFKKEVGKTK